METASEIVERKGTALLDLPEELITAILDRLVLPTIVELVIYYLVE